MKLLRLVPGALACVALAASRAVPTDVVLVANQQGASVSILDATAHATLATLPTGDGPHEVAASADGRTAVVTNYGGQSGPGSSLTVIDLAKRTVRATRGHSPWGSRSRRTGAAAAELAAGAPVMLISFIIMLTI